MIRALVLLSLICAPALAKRVLYVTHSAGFRHDSIRTSLETMRAIAARDSRLSIDATEDVSRINAASLRDYDAVFFFTSGELPLSDAQKRDLLDFVRSGKGFGGAHSATDTLYSWPEYGDLIGGVFDGHPWVHEATVDVEDPDHPAMRHLPLSFRYAEEFYQFRAFSRDRVRVLMTLNANSIDTAKEGVNRTDRDFALTWVRNYGQGRVFYTALGHLDETWRDERFVETIRNALLWITGEVDGDASVRISRPLVSRAGTLNSPTSSIAPGALITVEGAGLTSGQTLTAPGAPWPTRLAGTALRINGVDAPLLHASPERLMALAPLSLPPDGRADLAVVSGVEASPVFSVGVGNATPAILAAVANPAGASIYAVGLGAVTGQVAAGAPAPLDRLVPTAAPVQAFANGSAVAVSFSGLAPGLIGVYQVNAAAPAGSSVTIEVHGSRSNAVEVR